MECRAAGPTTKTNGGEYIPNLILTTDRSILYFLDVLGIPDQLLRQDDASGNNNDPIGNFNKNHMEDMSLYHERNTP